MRDTDRLWQAAIIAGAVSVALYIKNKNTSTMTNSSDYPRGYRNNNPLNIVISDTQWKGKVPHSSDSRFEQFITMEYGYRAALINIRTYIEKYGLNTVEAIISRWAPTTENNTQGYIKRVCSTTGYSANTVINPNNKEQMCKLVYAMAIVENGTKYLPDMATIEKGWNMI